MQPKARAEAEKLGVSPELAKRHGSLARSTTWKIAVVEQTIGKMQASLCPHADPMDRVKALALSIKALEIVEKS